MIFLLDGLVVLIGGLLDESAPTFDASRGVSDTTFAIFDFDFFSSFVKLVDDLGRDNREGAGLLLLVLLGGVL